MEIRDTLYFGRNPLPASWDTKAGDHWDLHFADVWPEFTVAPSNNHSHTFFGESHMIKLQLLLFETKLFLKCCVN